MLKTNILIYLQQAASIGGIETFIINFVSALKDSYDITIMYNQCDPTVIKRIRKIARVISADTDVECDTLITNRLHDRVPFDKIKYNQHLQLLHGNFKYTIAPVKRNEGITFVGVSDYVLSTYNLDGEKTTTIHNLTKDLSKPDKVLKLVSATRLSGEKGEHRMYALARLLKENDIPFVWVVLTNKFLDNRRLPEGMVRMSPTERVQDWYKWADYTVQLSDDEGFGYTLVESLELGTPLITTPLPVLKELNIEDGVNAIVCPFDMQGIDVKRIYKGLKPFEYKNNNADIIKQWKALLGKEQEFIPYEYKEDKVNVRSKCFPNFLDGDVNHRINFGDIYRVERDRANYLVNLNYVEITDKPVNVDWQN